MSDNVPYREKQDSSNRAIANLFLALILAWAFLGTIDGPTMNVGIDTGSVLHLTARAPDRAQVTQLDLLWIGRFPQRLTSVPLSFLLFDLKQNLRRWPNIAGDISRSPPLYAL